MSTENKNEKAGAAKASATPSKVEESQDIFNGAAAVDQEKDAIIKSLKDENAELKASASHSAELQSHIDGLKSEVQEKNELLKSRDADIVALKDENAALKEDVTSLKANVAHLEGNAGQGGSTEKTEKRFIVINSFRSNNEADKGKVYDINTDVSDFDTERLKDLVGRNLVKEV